MKPRQIIKQRTVFLLTFLTTILLSTALRGQECEKLENGKYKIKPKGFADYELQIDNDDFITTAKDGKQNKGKIIWTSTCVFVLNYEKQKEQTDSLDFFQKIHKGWGQQCFDLAGAKSNKFRQTWTGNLHVTSSEGRIARVKN